MIRYIEAKSVVQRAKGGWFGADYNMNLYRGCSHGCIYCDSRSACYGEDDFGTVKVKKDALRLVRDDLARKIRPGVVATGAMSDPYNPLERRLQLTRHALELLAAYGFGVAVATKGTLVTRDCDLFEEIGRAAPVLVKLTITTADDALAAQIEPYAPPPSERFSALRTLSEAGIFCGVLLMPVLPFLTDGEKAVRELARRTAEAGGRFCYPWFGMTLRDRQRTYYYAELERRFPGLAAQYRRRYGERYACTVPRARELYRAFAAECEQLGLLYRMEEITRAYRVGYAESQLRFF